MLVHQRLYGVVFRKNALIPQLDMVVIDAHLIPCANLELMHNAIEYYLAQSILRYLQRLFTLKTLVMNRTNKIFVTQHLHYLIGHLYDIA